MARSEEEQLDLIIQGGGLAASVVGVGVLVHLALNSGNAMALPAALAYGAALIVMFICSILNAAARHPRRKSLICLLDHSAIYLLIAGTYTPFCLLVIGGDGGVTLLTGIWVAALLGVLFRVLWHRRLKGAIITLYVLLGWSGVIYYHTLYTRVTDSVLILLAAGGVLFTAGSPVHRWAALRYHSAIWHGCVVAAVACHYAAILMVLSAGPGMAME